MDKKYLGDGVYLEFDGYHVILSTHNDYNETNRIYLEPAVYEYMVETVKREGERVKSAE